MSTSDVRLANINNNVPISDNTSTKGPNIGDNLATGNDRATLPEVDNTTVITKIERQKSINKILEDYKLKKEEILPFFKEIFNYTEDQLLDCNQVSDEKFKSMCELIEITLDSFINVAETRSGYGKFSNVNEGITKSIKLIKKMLDNGNTIDEAKNFIETFEDKSILEILQIDHPELKKYKSLENVPENIVIEIVKALIDKFVVFANTNSKNNIGESYKIISNLIERAEKKNEASILLNAFMKVAAKDERFEGVRRSISMLKDKPEILDELLNDETLSNILHNIGITPDQIKELLTELFNSGLDPVQIAQKLEGYIKPLTKKYNALKNKSDLTPEEKQFFETFEKIDKGNILAIVQFLLQQIELIGEDMGRSFLECAQDGEFYDSLMQNLADFFNNNQNDKAKEILNTITDNKFTEICEQKAAQSVSETTNTANTQDIGLPQKVTADVVAQSEKRISESPVVKDNNYSEKSYYEVLPSTSNDDNDFSLRTIGSKTLAFVQKGLDMNKYEIPDLISICTTQKNGVKEVVSNFFKNLDKDRFTFYVNQLGSQILKTEFILNNKNVDYANIQDNVKLTYNALAQVKEKTEEKEKNNRPELT